jgi:hypothetical protein
MSPQRLTFGRGDHARRCGPRTAGGCRSGRGGASGSAGLGPRSRRRRLPRGAPGPPVPSAGAPAGSGGHSRYSAPNDPRPAVAPGRVDCRSGHPRPRRTAHLQRPPVCDPGACRPSPPPEAGRRGGRARQRVRRLHTPDRPLSPSDGRGEQPAGAGAPDQPEPRRDGWQRRCRA